MAGLTAEENRICDVMRINPHAFIEAREREREDAARSIAVNQEDQTRSIGKMMGMSDDEIQSREAGVTKEEAAHVPLTPEELEGCRKFGVEPLDYWATKMAEAGLKPQLPA